MYPTRQNAYTLVELLVVVTIFLILGSLLLTGLNSALARAGLLNCQSNLNELGIAITQYTIRHQGLLPEFSRYRWIGQIDLLEGGEYGWKRLSEYPQYADLPGAKEDPGFYFIITPRQSDLFVCPGGKKQRINLQGVDSSYAGISKHDYAWLAGFQAPERTILLIEYDADESNIEVADDNQTIYTVDIVGLPDDPQLEPVKPYRVARNHKDCGNVLFMDHHVECVTGQALVLLYWDDDFSTSTTTTSTSTSSSTTTSINGADGTNGGNSDGQNTGNDGATGGANGGGNTGGDNGTNGGGNGTTTTIPGDSGGNNNNGAGSTSSTSTTISTTSSTTTTSINKYKGPPW